MAAARGTGGRCGPFTSGTRAVSRSEAPPYEALGSPQEEPWGPGAEGQRPGPAPSDSWSGRPGCTETFTRGIKFCLSWAHVHRHSPFL